MNRQDYFEEYGQSFETFQEIQLKKRLSTDNFNEVFLFINTYTQHGVLMNNFVVQYGEEIKITNNYTIAMLWFDVIDTDD